MECISPLPIYKSYLLDRSPPTLFKKLLKAIQHDDTDLIQLWITRGASVSHRDTLGNTPLHVAAMLGHFKSIVLLLEFGASPLERNDANKTSLEIAQELNSFAITQVLDQALRSSSTDNSNSANMSREELSLLNRIIGVGKEEDVISNEMIKIKLAMRDRKRNIALDQLLNQLKQPWELHQSKLKRWIKKADNHTNTKSWHYTQLIELIDKITALEQSLGKKRKNETICASLNRIHTVYQEFITNCAQLNEKERGLLLQGRICFRGVTVDCRYLNLETVEHIFPKEKTNVHGKHAVGSYDGIHWKQEPTAPGIEKACLELIKLVCRQGSPPTVLLNFRKETKTVPVLASHTIEGKSLEDVMRKNPEWISLIDPTNFSMMVFLGFLLDPYDGKPDNFIVIIHKDEQETVDKLFLSSIDNDLSLSDVFVRSDGRKLLLLDLFYVLFVFPQMHLPVDSSFREQFLSLVPEEVIMEWLKSMMQQNELYQELLKKKVFAKEEFYQLNLPFALRPQSGSSEGFVEGLYRKLCSLQLAMENPKLTHWELFRLIQPLAAEVYQRRIDDYKTTTPREEQNLFHCYMGRIHNDANIENLLTEGGGDILNRSAFTAYQQLQRAGDKRNSRTLSPEVALERFIPLIPWYRASLNEQRKWLYSIALARQIQELIFLQVEALDDEFLTKAVIRLPHVHALTLIGCPRITGSGLFSLLKEKPCLQLTLGECPGLKHEDYVLIKNNIFIRFPSGKQFFVLRKEVEFLYEAIRAKDEMMLFFALSLGVPAESQALLMIAQLEHSDGEQLKRWLTVLFFQHAVPDEEVMSALAVKPDLYDHMMRLKKSCMALALEAERREEPWIKILPWSNYFNKQ